MDQKSVIGIEVVASIINIVRKVDENIAFENVSIPKQ